MRDPEDKEPVRVHLWFINLLPGVYVAAFLSMLFAERAMMTAGHCR